MPACQPLHSWNIGPNAALAHLGVTGLQVARQRAQEDDHALAHAVVAGLIRHVLGVQVALKQRQHGRRVGLAVLCHDGHACAPAKRDVCQCAHPKVHQKSNFTMSI